MLLFVFKAVRVHLVPKTHLISSVCWNKQMLVQTSTYRLKRPVCFWAEVRFSPSDRLRWINPPGLCRLSARSAGRWTEHPPPHLLPRICPPAASRRGSGTTERTCRNEPETGYNEWQHLLTPAVTHEASFVPRKLETLFHDNQLRIPASCELARDANHQPEIKLQSSRKTR